MGKNGFDIHFGLRRQRELYLRPFSFSIQPMYKAVFIDMDGTLLQTDHTVSEANKKEIKRLLDMGIIVVPISARPLHGILPITQQVVPGTMPVVSLNGSYIFHNGEIIYEASVDLPEVVSIHQHLVPFDVSVMYYSRMDWFTAKESKLVVKEQAITTVKIKIQPFESTMEEWRSSNNGPNKILIAGESALINNVERQLLNLHREKLNIYQSQAGYLEVMNLQASKANAIAFLLNQYGLHKGEIIAIGDNYNDKGMIEFAGIGVAMGNAPDEIKRVADHVTDTNNNDGVAKALRYFFK
ncbi:MAG: family phosphatase [Ferruginibacter sp.]|nr:family phosphatase [Ferruginibacter sp.]